MWNRQHRPIVDPWTNLTHAIDEANEVPSLHSILQSPQAEEEPDDETGFEPCGLDTRSTEKRTLGNPENRDTCFGCIYVGERETGAVYEEDLTSLMDMIVQSIGQTDIVCLVNEVARRYAEIREQTNNNLMAHEKPLPEWKAATILDHFRNHHCDPEFMLWMSLKDLREAKEVALHSMIEQNPKTKRKRINRDGVRAYSELCKLEWTVGKIDPSKCLFYNAGRHLDVKGLSAGPIATSFKPLAKMFKDGNKR